MVARLEHTAMHDGLTALANRSLFLDRVEVARTRLRRRPSRTFAVLFLDLDGFKQINDTLGHAAGDRLLQTVAARLCECVRPQDTVARFGGDEFAMLLDETVSAGAAVEIAERVQTAVAQPILDDAGEMSVAASIGIAFVASHGAPTEEILRQADVAMYHAKGAGKSCHRAYDDRMTMLARAS
jgi:diguanylate cyclase (GGDEF)-like protein